MSASGTPPPRPAWRDRSLWLRSAVYVLIAVGLSNLLVNEAIDQGPIALVRESIASAAASVLRFFGTSATAVGDRVQMTRGAVQIVNACTGFDVSILLSAAILVFPATWRARLLGVLIAFAVLMPLNFLRVLTLAWAVNSRPDVFELSHYYIWPTIVIVVCLATLLGWIQLLALRERSP
jgi:exosortase/archaeosortase family protein